MKAMALPSFFLTRHPRPRYPVFTVHSASASGRDAVYVQDDWKILPKLTLNLGLRYSYEQPNYEVNNKMVNVNLDYARGKPFGTPIDSMLGIRRVI